MFSFLGFKCFKPKRSNRLACKLGTTKSSLIFKALIALLKRAVVLCLFFIPSYAFSSDWIYTVRKGDTLWNLCITYTDVPNCWLKIGEYNGVDYPKSMAPGTRIKFPVAWLKNPPTTVKIMFVRGEVYKTLLSGESEAAVKGMELSIGDSLRTGDGSSSTLLFADGSILILEDNSDITMDLLSLARDKSMVDSRVNLRRGSASTRVPKTIGSDVELGSKTKHSRTRKPNMQRRFEVKTPSAVAAVRGTEFRVSVRDSGEAMGGEVYAGEVAVSQKLKDKANQKSLTKKYGIVVEKDKQMGNPVELLSAPEINNKNFTQYSELSVSWNKLRGASRYVLSLFHYSQKDNLLTTLHTDETTYRFEGLKLGCYLVALRGIDRFELQGLVVEEKFCLEASPGPPIANVKHDKNYNGSVLSWEPVLVTDEYQVEFSDSESFDTIKKAVPAYETSYSITMVEKRDYEFIRVRNRLGNAVMGPPSKAFRTKE